MTVDIQPVREADDFDWCAGTMASTDPWITLGRDVAACRRELSNPIKERYIVRADGMRAGVLILDMNAVFGGYIQSICLAPSARNRGVGSRVIAWAEDRIFRESPNVFLCVSSFNTDAQRLYHRLGYETVGVLKRFVVDEHDEWLLRKTQGSWQAFRSGLLARGKMPQ
jgi:ribosomal protein S18 acetylase RimI-like enzyme